MTRTYTLSPIVDKKALTQWPNQSIEARISRLIWEIRLDSSIPHPDAAADEVMDRLYTYKTALDESDASRYNGYEMVLEALLMHHVSPLASQSALGLTNALYFRHLKTGNKG